MIKRFTSLIMCLIITATAFSMPLNAYAKSYKQQLLDSGFPESYVDALVTLHEKYPNWVFKPFKTELNWQDVIDGERTPHKQQALQKTSSRGSEWFCQCDKCKTPAEGSSWYAASEQAVKYYMDPRNSLTAEYIFQFESTAYESSQTQSGVEAIIASTWMKNANITYNSTENKSTTYKNSSGNTVKYSAAIIDAAKTSKMSAYYLASKIVQEVGSSSAAYAGGSSGTRKPFVGIYNYYNIGANTGAMDGLAWASGYLRTNKQTKLYDYDSTKKTFVVKKDDKGKEIVLKSEQYLSYISKSGNYIKGMLYNDSNNSTDGIVGYVPEDDLRTTYFTYGRPWTDPYKSIYYGAQYIAKGYSNYQYTGYLQKFNVNKASGNLYGHEYMINLAGAKSEASITYKAYKNNNLLTQAKTFYIPVFKNMPSTKCAKPTPSDTSTTTTTAAPTYQVKGLTLKSRTKTSLTFKWDKTDGATKYYVYVKNVTKGSNFDKTVTTNSATLNNLTPANEYSVMVKAYTSNGWGKYSEVNTKHALPDKMEKPKISAVGDTYATLSWSAVAGADGYNIYSYDSSSKKYTKLTTVSDGKAASVKVKGLKSASKNTLCISAFTVDSKTKEGAKSDKASATTALLKVSLKSVTSPKKTKIKAKWTATNGSENGYEICYARDKKFKKTVAKKLITSSKTASYTGKNFTKGVKYYVRVRSYKTVNGKKKYGSWSNVKSVKSK